MIQERIIVAPFYRASYNSNDNDDDDNDSDFSNNNSDNNNQQLLNIQVQIEASVLFPLTIVSTVSDIDTVSLPVIVSLNDTDKDDNDDDNSDNDNNTQSTNDQYIIQQLFNEYSIQQLTIQMANIPSQAFPTSLIETYLSSSSSSSSSLLLNGPSGLLVQAQFICNDSLATTTLDNTYNRHSQQQQQQQQQLYLYYKKQFISLLQELVYNRYIIAPLEYKSFTNRRLHRYVIVENYTTNTNNSHNNNNNNTIIQVSVYLPFDGTSSSIVSGEGMVSFINSWYRNSNSNSNSKNNGGSIFGSNNKIDPLVWSNWMLGGISTSIGHPTVQQKQQSNKKFHLSMDPHNNNNRRSLYMSWKRKTTITTEDPNSKSEMYIQYSCGIRYTVEQQQEQEDTTVTRKSPQITIQDLFPPGIIPVSSISTTIAAATTTPATMKSKTLLQQKPIQLHIIIPSNDDNNSENSKTMMIEYGSHCVQAAVSNKKSESTKTTNNVTESKLFMVERSTVISKPASTSLSTTTNYNEFCFQLHENSNDHNKINNIATDDTCNTYDDDTCYSNSNSNNHKITSNRLLSIKDKEQLFNPNQLLLNYYTVHLNVIRHGGQDTSGTFVATFVNQHPYCSVSINVIQSLPSIIKPIWKSLHGSIIPTIGTSEQQQQDQNNNNNNNNKIQYIQWSEFDSSTVLFPDYQLTTNEFYILQYTHTIQYQSQLIVSLSYQPLYIPFESFPGDANRGFEIPPIQSTFTLVNNNSNNNNNNNTIQNDYCKQYIQSIHSSTASSSASSSFVNIHQEHESNTTTYTDFHTSENDSYYYNTISIVLYSNPLLVLSPLPDMSMIYNVLSFTCAFYAFIIGSLLNLLIRKSNETIKYKLYPNLKPKSKISILKTKMKIKLASVMKTISDIKNKRIPEVISNNKITLKTE